MSTPLPPPSPTPDDSAPEPGTSPARRVAVIVGRTLSILLVAVTALMVLGALVDDIPVLGYSTAIVGLVPAWFVILALFGALLAWASWRSRPSRWGHALLALGVLAAVGGAVVTGRQVNSVQSAGADVDVLASVGSVWQPRSVEPDADPVYLTDQGDDLRVSVYEPSGNSGAAPVLLYVHGGGWSENDRTQYSTDMRWIADRGYLVLSIDYSLSSPSRHLWNDVQGQIGCALSWVTENAAQYGGDPARLSLTGDSAGGNLALNTAYLQAAGTLPSACGGTAPDVASVSVLYPGVDLETISDFSTAGAGFTSNYTGGSPEEYPERYRSVDSAELVTADGPPTLILTGESDHIVPPQSVYDFEETARDAGVETKLVRVPHADHVFNALPGSIGSQAYRQLTVQWMRDHGQAP